MVVVSTLGGGSRVASPEMELIAAMIRVAVEDARAGDQEARAWVGSGACHAWLSWLAPAGVDAEGLHERLMKTIDGA